MSDQFDDKPGDDLGGGFDDAVFVEFMAPPQVETLILPAMYAVPASALGILPQGTRVTVGMPGSHWVIEENIISTGPHPDPDGGDEWYELVAWAEWGAITTRPHEQVDLPAGRVRVQPWRAPVSALWVYRFATTRAEVDELPARDPNGWFANIRTDLDTPPSPRYPRPARELPSLTGRRLHAATRDGIGVFVAVSEPLDVDGEFVVRLLSLNHYARASYGNPNIEVTVLPLHQLWAY